MSPLGTWWQKRRCWFLPSHRVSLWLSHSRKHPSKPFFCDSRDAMTPQGVTSNIAGSSASNLAGAWRRDWWEVSASQKVTATWWMNVAEDGCVPWWKWYVTACVADRYLLRLVNRRKHSLIRHARVRGGRADYAGQTARVASKYDVRRRDKCVNARRYCLAWQRGLSPTMSVSSRVCSRRTRRECAARRWHINLACLHTCVRASYALRVTRPLRFTFRTTDR